MPLLVYCIAEAGSKIEIPPCGVQGASLRTLIESGLICFLSDYDPSVGGNHVRDAALNFNRVLQELLRQAAILPFRFPTLLADESEIRGVLQQHASEYRDALGRLRDVLQVEITLTLSHPPQPEDSGKKYLLSRQHSNRTLADAADAIHQQLGAHIQDWRLHQSSNATRCYMLVSRDDLKRIFEKVRELKISSDLRARVTGPWPATDFIALPLSEGEKSPSANQPVPSSTEKNYG